ncbi:glycosyltransferase family 4 protein [Niallia sp. JL1B1071]|uniref:glycosyltransferase family 4 protein n=1 Tax=Niallia tiangongensis TaxID=3237105 RepID=UPI0037DCAEC8
MKVLFLTNLPSPYRVYFFSELGKKCDLTVLYERRSASDRNENWSVEIEKSYKEIYLDSIKIGTDNSVSIEVLKYLNNKFDHIIVGMYSTVTAMVAIAYMKIKNIPFIISSDGGFIKKEKKLNYNIKKFFISAASGWLSSGSLTTDYLVNYGANRKRTYTYPFTSLAKKDILEKPLAKNEKYQIRSKLDITENRVVLSVGQFIHRKGFDLLLNATKEIDKDIGIYIIGGKPTDEYLRIKDKYNLKNVHFVEFLKEEQLADYYKCADVFILPTREDIWGLVINEAMAFGLPVITTNRCIAGMELVIEGKNGYIMEVDNINDIQSSITKVFKNDLYEMGVSSIEVITNYTFENMANTTLKVLKELT